MTVGFTGEEVTCWLTTDGTVEAVYYNNVQLAISGALHGDVDLCESVKIASFNAQPGAVLAIAGYTSNALEADILHWVRVCNQCRVDWCNGNWRENTPTVEDRYQVGSTLDAWGCGMVTGRTARTRNSVTGNIYVIERGKLSIETPTHGQGGLALSCSSSSGPWNQVNPYSDWKVFSSPIEEPPIDWHSNSFEDNAW